MLYDTVGSAPTELLDPSKQQFLLQFGIAMWDAVVENFRSRINALDDWPEDTKVIDPVDIQLGEALAAYYGRYVDTRRQEGV